MTARRAPNLLTVVQREFLRDGRKWQTWALRAGFSAALFLLVAILWAQAIDGGESIDRVEIGRTGRRIYGLFVGLQTLCLVLVTPVLVASAVIEEREGGTLPLLALTRLSPGGILGGKVLARVLQLELVVLGGLPFLAVCSSLGGFGPLDLVNIFVQSTTMIVGLAAVSAFLALYSDGAFRPAIQAWSWTLGAWGFGVMPHVLMRLDGEAAASVSPYIALSQATGWQILAPPIAQLPVSFGILWFAVAGLRAMLAGADEETDGFGSLGTEFEGLRKVRNSLAWTVAVLLLSVPVLLFQKPMGVIVPPLGHLSILWASGWIWLGSGIYLLTMRYALLKRARKAKGAPMKRWAQLTKEWDGGRRGWSPVVTQDVRRAPRPSEGRTEGGTEAQEWASAPADARQQAPGVDPMIAKVGSLSGRRARRGDRVTRSRRWSFAKEVWDDGVLWRETMTRAWGGLGGSLTRLSVAFSIIVGILFFFGAFRSPELCVIVGTMAFAYAGAAVLLSASASIASELQHGTLALLLASRLSAPRILLSKLKATAVHAAPAWALAVFLFLLAAGVGSENLSRARSSALLVRWFALSLWTGVALTALAISCHSIGLRARSAALVWVWTVLWAGLNIVGPVLARIFVDGIDIAEHVVHAWNPLLSEGTWDHRGVPHHLFVSSLVWAVIGLGAFLQNTQLIRRRAAR